MNQTPTQLTSLHLLLRSHMEERNGLVCNCVIKLPSPERRHFSQRLAPTKITKRSST